MHTTDVAALLWAICKLQIQHCRADVKLLLTTMDVWVCSAFHPGLAKLPCQSQSLMQARKMHVKCSLHCSSMHACAQVKQAEAPKVEAKAEPVAASSFAAPPPPAPSAPSPPPPPSSAPAPRADGRVIATPYAKKLAKELGVDLSTLGGSGPEGRITASDVQNHRNGACLLHRCLSALPHQPT